MWIKRWLMVFLLAPAALACGNDDQSGVTSGAGARQCAPLSDSVALVTAYAEAWNADDHDVRLCLLEQSLVDDVKYVDPSRATHDRAALSEAIGEFRARTPGASIGLVRGPAVRAGDLRASWDLWISGTQALSGVDYYEISESGRIAAVWSYWDPFETGSPMSSVTSYVDAWNAPDASARAAALATAFGEGAHLRDGITDARGVAAIDRMIASVREAGEKVFTEVKFQAHGSPPTHARLELAVEGEHARLTTVTDYIRFDAQGKIDDAARFAEP